MTSSTFTRAGVGAVLAFGLAVAPLAIPPAMATEETPPAEASASAHTQAPAAPADPAPLDAAHVVINEAYLNGGSANATYKNKFVELYNPSDADIDLSGWSLQYRSATGQAAPTGLAQLSGTIKAKDYYLVKGNSNGAVGKDLPASDADASGFSFAGGGGTLILSNQGTRLPADLASGSLVGAADIVDLLGYGSSNTFEVKASSAANASSSLNRTAFADTDSNAADFSTATPSPVGTGGGDGPGTPPVDSGVKSIAEIQGTGAASPLVGTTVTTRGKVTAAYPTGGFNGYYIQTPGTGGDLDMGTHQASDGVFVYSPATVAGVKIGDHVEVSGLVKEFGGASNTATTTEIDVAAGGLTQLSEPATEVKPAAIAVPSSVAQRETLEGMLVAPEGDFTITDNYSLNNYGEIGLATGTTPLIQPTAVAPYGSDKYTATVSENAARAIKLDDGASTNFLSTAGSTVQLPWLGQATPMRVGSTARFTAPVIFDNRNNTYKFQPLEALTPANAGTVQPVTFGNTRHGAPKPVGGNLKVASFNVQNYFTETGDKNVSCEFYTDYSGNKISVKGGCPQRGAADAANLQRQQDKIVAGIIATDADVLSLEEVENSAKFGKDRDSALATLVEALNAEAPGVWDYVRSPAADQRPAVGIEDAIRTAFIYKKASAEPVGGSTILDHQAFTGIARQPLAQSFKPAGSDDSAQVLLIVNHFKSKGSAIGGDTDQGQGNSNLARTAQAEALVEFSTRLQASQGTDKVLLMGDFNAYGFEDPIRVMTDAGYVDQDPKTGKHSYSFGGMVGSLDHVLASPAAEAAVTGADIWNINSAESVAMGYSRYGYNATNFYDASPFAASDHDPVVVGLQLGEASSATKEVNLLNINDFHGRIDANTVKFAGTVEQLRAESGEGSTAFLSAGDNIGASLFASASQDDLPTIDVLNALDLRASALGNHEFDKGYQDLVGRVSDAADWDYLGANVYAKGTKTPVMDEYKVITLNGVKVAVIGAITQETPTLVTPSGISSLDFGDPVEAVNRVAQQITDGDLADVIVAEYHDGAGSGTPDGATMEDEIAAEGTFREIATKTSAEVDAIFTGHTHKQYAWDAPIPGVSADAALKTRPVLQTGSYGEFIGRITLKVDTASDEVLSYEQGNVPRTKADDASLVAKYPRVAAVKTITDKALADAKVAGSVPVGKISADITTAQTFDPATGKYTRDDRANESTLGNLVGNALLETLKSEQAGGAEIAVVNPGGLRADLLHKNAGVADGVVTYANANAVLPFVNNLWTTSLTGAQVKTMLEQQWQTNADGSTPSRPFLNLGLSSNMDYTYDSTRAKGDRITSVTVNGQALDPKRSYRVGTFSFLATGGDNFRVFTEGTNTKDSGLIDRDAWIKYLGQRSETGPIAPDFARRGVEVVGNPARVDAKGSVAFQLNKLDLTSLGSPKNTAVTVEFTDNKGKRTVVDTVGVRDGSAKVSFRLPADARTSGTITVKAAPSGTTVKLPLLITNPNEKCKPKQDAKACA
ncbi:ExeM/NucH family extracellular endonuclease [Paeniglutamicibacter sp. R2-26]|uniref:ExeM/NucH family extracellular endonuclease n=1 Tax=Paeniglutamicibacter sp. R2-26 TaxID=3144417 RepID=UPI003EE74D34